MRALVFVLGLMAALAAGAADAADAVELEFWRSVEASGARADYQAYLNRYPYGDFADLARNRLGAASASGGSGAGEGGFLSYADRRAAQAALTRQGYDTRGVDGVFGPGTRRAIRQWQADQGYAVTGYLSRAQFDTLTRTAAPPPRRKVRDEAAWEVAVAQGDIAGYQRYLERYPDGAHAQQARNRIERKLEKRADSGYGVGGGVRAQREAALGLNRSQREAVEWRLSRAGYYPGAINGRFDSDTRRAIRAFRRDNGLANHAYLSRKMLRKLVRRTGGYRRDRGYGEDYSNFAAGAAVGALALGGIILLAD